MKEEDFFNITRGYIKRADGSWICCGEATPADMQFHCWYFEEFYRGENPSMQLLLS